MDKKRQVEILKYILGRIYRSDEHKNQLDARIRGIGERQKAAAARFPVSDIAGRILEQKREIDQAVTQVLDILDCLPVNSIERQICELRYIDYKPWSVISAEIPMSRSQVYRRYKTALNILLSNQYIQNIVKEHEDEYEKYIHGRLKKSCGDADVKNSPGKIPGWKPAGKTGRE